MKLLDEFIKLYIDKNRANSLIEKFYQYEKILLDWNKKINLISRKQTGIEKIILDSIFFLSDFKFNGDEKIIDIGTGGGFPGIPLKIIFPELKITLLDSINKKIKALDDIVRRLELYEIETVCGRAEIVSRDSKYRLKYDIVISKAVADLINLYKWGKDFMKINGKMICIKGGNIDEELKTFNKKYSIKNMEIKSYSLSSLLPDYKSFLDKNYFGVPEAEDLKHIIIFHNYEN